MNPTHYTKKKALELSTAFNIGYVSQSKVYKTIKALQPKASSGLDQISNKLLKAINNEISFPLAKIINKCFDEGVMPPTLKIAKVIYLHKGNATTEMGNYRPISLLPTLSKIIEKIFTKGFQDHMETNKLWYRNQFGFREGHSTVHALLTCRDTIESALNKKKYVALVSLDVAKAFNCLQKEVLQQKLSYYGIEGKEAKFINSFLSDRYQKSEINGALSEKTQIDMGIPQGGVLSAPLYILLNNDLNEASLNTSIIYADDTMLLITADSMAELEINTNKELASISQWYTSNKLTLNERKTMYLVFVPKGKKNAEINLHLNQIPIERVGAKYKTKAAKLLGVLVDDKLDFNEHFQKVIKKVKQGLFGLCRAKHHLTVEAKKLVYSALIKPHLEYAITVWAPKLTKQQAERLTILQKKAIRAIFNAPYNSHTDELFKTAETLHFVDLLKLEMAKLAHSIANEEAPQSLSYRNQTKTLDKTRVPLKGLPTDLIFDLTKTWNQMDQALQEMADPKAFAKALQSQLRGNTTKKCNKQLCNACHGLDKVRPLLARLNNSTQKPQKNAVYNTATHALD